jgi:CheY-like chemotaxis protein
MKKFLFLDDTQERHDHFDKLCQDLYVEVWHVRTAKQAIGRLQNMEFDTVWLDHDLEDTDRHNTGFAVAKFIAVHLPLDRRPGFVVIHSWNPDGAQDMAHILRDNGFRNVRQVPFSFKE